MIEVAKRAGVSTATISRVINRQSGVSEATAANVRRAMAELGYTPPASRRGPKLGSRRSPRLLNVLFVMFARGSSNRTTGFQRLMSGASSQLDETSANLTVKFVSTPDEVRALALSQSNVDGILAHGTSPEGDVVSQFRDVPTVWLMGNPVRPTWGDQVMPDSDAIGTIAARHLSESGCKEVAHLNLLPGSWALSLHSRAFLDSAVELGIRAESFESSNPIGSSFFDDYAPDSSGRIVEAADRLVDDLLNRMPKVRGIFIAEDRQASVLVPALQRRGIALALEDD
ncbi:MAG: LacI family DNA-binding transcriptional regulator, partial [Pseudomonadota bacterium]